jgi:hypothetical protein
VKGILLKKYQNCSDEEIGSSVFCNYFDEGSTFSEIMQHYSKKYEDLFELVNFRNIQENYNILDNSGYLFFKDAQFERIRKIFETWEVFADQEIFDLKDAPIKDQRLKIQKKLDYCRENKDPKCQFILDLDNATTLAGKFFLKILKTPNHQCLVKFQKSEIIIPLSFLHRVLALPYAPKSCFDSIIPTITDKGEVGVIVGERGRFLSDSPEYNPKYTMNTDLSARGIWIDKLLAVKYLVGRNLSVNRYRDPHLSFLDHPVIGPEIEEFVEDLITQEPLDKPTPFRDKIGRIIKTNQKISRIILSGNNNSLIPQQISLSLIYSLNLPLNSSFFLSTAILKALIGNSEVGDPTLLRKGEEFQLKLGVKRVEEQIILDTNKFFPEIVLSDGKKYFGSKDFKLASKIISDLNYFNFLENYRPLRDYLEKYDPPSTQEKIFILLSKIYYLKMNPYLDISLRGKTFADPFSGLEGPQKIALEFSANILEKIKNIFELPEAEFLMKFSNEDPNLKIPERALFLKNNLSKEQIEKSREFLLESYKPGTDFAFGELYDLNEPDLNRLLNLTGTKVRVEIEDLLKNLRPY